MKMPDYHWEAQIARGRHVRLAGYVALCLSLTLLTYYQLGLDREHALAYAVSSYVLLVMLNFRHVLSKIEPPVTRRFSK